MPSGRPSNRMIEGVIAEIARQLIKAIGAFGDLRDADDLSRADRGRPDRQGPASNEARRQSIVTCKSTRCATARTSLRMPCPALDTVSTETRPASLRASTSRFTALRSL